MFRVAGVAIMEGEVNRSGDGRVMEHGALNWDGMLPFDIVWDREDGDHSAMIVGHVDSMSRRADGAILYEGALSETEDPVTQAAINRIVEILNEGATGVSLRWDAVTCEIRVKKSVIDEQMAMMAQMMSDDPADAPEMELTPDGSRVITARFSVDDALEVTTSARPRHLAIVDTGAWPQASMDLVVTGSIAAAGMIDQWLGNEHFFDDPKFGDPATDPRLRYDPERDLWSCPNTVDFATGRVFGHITPMGICLRGRPERCVSPPDGDLEGFMRGRAPAAGGKRTGVISCGGGSSHCDVGIGIAEATKFYDRVGHGAADVRVGRDRYGIWYAGMIRPGTDPNDVYAFAASDVSGHWEYPLNGVKNRATLVGLPAVNVGGFPKGYLTYHEYANGLAASGGITVEDGCGTWFAGQVESDDIGERLARIEYAVGEMYAAHLLARDV